MDMDEVRSLIMTTTIKEDTVQEKDVGEQIQNPRLISQASNVAIVKILDIMLQYVEHQEIVKFKTDPQGWRENSDDGTLQLANKNMRKLKILNGTWVAV